MKMKTKKKLALGLVLTMGLTMFAGCGNGGDATTDDSAATDGAAAIKIGGTGPLTGGASN